MPTRSVRIIGAAGLLVAIIGCAEDACRGSDAKYYNEAVASQLKARGVAQRVSGDVVCVSGRNAERLRAAQAAVDATFHEVAYLLKDACEEQAFAAWAKREGLRFDIRGTLDMNSQPSGRMFLLRSFTPEEVASNRTRLDSGAPKKATCSAGK